MCNDIPGCWWTCGEVTSDFCTAMGWLLNITKIAWHWPFSCSMVCCCDWSCAHSLVRFSGNVTLLHTYVHPPSVHPTSRYVSALDEFYHVLVLQVTNTGWGRPGYETISYLSDRSYHWREVWNGYGSHTYGWCNTIKHETCCDWQQLSKDVHTYILRMWQSRVHLWCFTWLRMM